MGSAPTKKRSEFDLLLRSVVLTAICMAILVDSILWSQLRSSPSYALLMFSSTKLAALDMRLCLRLFP